MSREHRSSFRFILPNGQDQAVLRVGRQNLRAKIVNASATGFLLECPKADAVAGDILTLATTAGLCEIRVAFAEIISDQMRLGVERIREFDEHASGAGIPWYAVIPGCGRAAVNSGNIAVAVLALVALVAGGAYLVGNWPSSAPYRTTQAGAVDWISRKVSQTDRQVQGTIRRFGDWLQGKSPVIQPTAGQPHTRAVADWSSPGSGSPSLPSSAAPSAAHRSSADRISPILTTKLPGKQEVSASGNP